MTKPLPCLLALSLLCLCHITWGQCNLEETIIICDMTQLDYDNDGQADGIINLYDEYTNLTGNTIQQGTWFDPEFNFALETDTGNLHLWDLFHSSESTTDYQFLLTNADCGSDTALTLNVVLGPFSGTAVPTINEFDVNVETCDLGIDPCGSSSYFNLNQALLSIPSAHNNGVWNYTGSSPNFLGIQDNTHLLVDIPYQPGVPLVDEETFELTYTVPGIDPCAPSMTTTVKISVIREVFSGAANQLNICETELINGDYANIDLHDDDFLVNEDIEGIWLHEDDDTGQLTDNGDSTISLTDVYNDLYATNPRFGCETFEYSYFVESRSAVCEDKTSTISFTVYEALRPFSQPDPAPEFCTLSPEGSVNLYDLLEFTTENGTLYDYPNDSCTNWTLVSGPSDLGLVSNTGDWCTTIEDPNYTAMGTVNLNNISNDDAGTYVFEFSVLPEYNCNGEILPETINTPPDGCDATTDLAAPCPMETAQVTIVINAINYAGEDSVVAFCEPDINNPVDLFSLLETNGETIYQGPLGTWTNVDTGDELSNPFNIPTVTDQQTFNLEYSTLSNTGNCPDTANLTLTIYEQYSSGTGSAMDVCTDAEPFDLFNVLTDNPSNTGFWIGPNGFTSSSNTVMFDPQTFDPGDYTYTVPTNGLCDSGETIVTVDFIQSLTAGSDAQTDVCRSDLQVDLNDLLTGADYGGTFIDVDNTGVLVDNIVDVSQLEAGTYTFQYEIQAPGCELSTAQIELTVMEGQAPNATDRTFCVTDLATIADLEVDTPFSYQWYDTATSNIPLPNDQLLVDGEDYFVSATNANGCETGRTQIVVTLLPITQAECGCEINDAISNNGDGINDGLDLCNFSEVFPRFELIVYNRYGTVVFKGNQNTETFNGQSNVSPSLGKQLPSGVYFYVFNPNDGETKPLQGHIYLSR